MDTEGLGLFCALAHVGPHSWGGFTALFSPSNVGILDDDFRSLGRNCNGSPLSGGTKSYSSPDGGGDSDGRAGAVVPTVFLAAAAWALVEEGLPVVVPRMDPPELRLCLVGGPRVRAPVVDDYTRYYVLHFANGVAWRPFPHRRRRRS